MQNITKTFDEKIDDEKVKAAQLKLKARAVLKALGLKPGKDTDELSFQVRETGGAGNKSVNIFTSKYEKWRFNISGYYPRAKNGEYIRPNDYNESLPSITVSSDKSVEQIVKDIKSRFMPSYEALLEKALAKIKSADDYEDLTLASMKAIKGKSLSEDETQRKVLYLQGYDHISSIPVSGDSVKLELYSVPLETAKKILAILKKKEA